MKTLISLLTLTTLLHADEPTQLFNGKDLTGWKVESLPQELEKAKTFWTVQNDAITLDTKGDKKHNYVWLISEKEFTDFDLTLQIKQPRPTTGNSGIQIRSRFGTRPDGKGHWMHGPQIDIHPPTPYRIGLIYDETWETQHWIHPVKPNWKINPADATHKVEWKANEWNTLRIRAEGTKIQTWLNGNPVTNYNGTGVLDDQHHKKHNVGLTGQIALQLHAKDDLSLQFKNIQVTPLPKK